ncbi:hypothetical protein EB796_021213 [Bugula neritina]|uniref:Uncharacterized protein n=1 Tax=Bugula neritina TaxID=10212 RepID=A0A7J7J4A0_BUGNE|nr:hypothetical protein EB796_021213 [Bugula neritina]
MRTENKSRLLSLHKLVKQSLKLFCKKEEEPDLLKKALIGFTRVLPKDGRRHQDRFLKFYSDHGLTLNSAIAHGFSRTPFVQLLHCDLLMGVAYCLSSQKGGVTKSKGLLKDARDKYCQLVMGGGYSYDRLLKEQSNVDVSQRHKEVACILYETGIQHSLLQDEEYRDFIDKLPQYHQLTEKDLNNMLNICEYKDLVNGHLTRKKLELFEEKGRERGTSTVLEIDTLVHVFISEILITIYRTWSKLHSKFSDSCITCSFVASQEVNECIQHSEAALEVSRKLYEETGVYLLAGLITDRERLAMEIDRETSSDKLRSIKDQLDELSNVGDDEGKRYAYEAGLMRSDLKHDDYHRMVCAEWKINCYGKLYQLEPANQEQHYVSGQQLLAQVEELARKQVFSNSALSYCYKYYAKFLSYCNKSEEAIQYVLLSMRHLGLSLRNGTEVKHPELDSPRFASLYSTLQLYCNKHKESDLPGYTRLLSKASELYHYLESLVTQCKEIDSEFPFLQQLLESLQGDSQHD